MEVDARVALVIECYLTAAACQAAAKATGLPSWREIAAGERRQAAGLLDDFIAGRGVGSTSPADRRGE